jgi:DNA-binding beta-propeller fold protein YncE/mono/diheme cytochrome c family protein
MLLVALFAVRLEHHVCNAEDLDRSPVDLVLADDESWLATANQTSNSVSLLRIHDGTVLDELQVGDRPAAIVRDPKSQQLLVTSSYSGDLQWIQVRDEKLESVASIHLGFQPHGMAIDSERRLVYVALADADRVAVVDLETKSLQGTIDVGRWPRYLALSRDGTRLAVGTSGDRGIAIVDTVARKLLHIDRFIGLNVGHMQLSNDGLQVYFPWTVYRRNPITDRNIRLGWVTASRLGRIGFGDTARREAISLDPPGEAVADAHGLAITSDDRYLAISASGSHELLVFALEGLPFLDRGSTDHIDEPLRKDSDRFFRIALGGRPMGIRISREDQIVYVANYLDNSVQVVSLSERRVIRRFFIGGDLTPSLVRQGETIFFDARRSLDQWYSCHTCHYEGGTNAVTMDTMNDGTAFTFKTVLPLHQLDQTGPWTWHGWQQDASQAMKHSLKTTMLGPEPTEDDARALVAYLASLKQAPNPNRSSDSPLNESAARGEKIFSGPKGECATCHSGPNYTDGAVHDLGLGSSNDSYVGFNTPSLLGVFRKVLLLHDGSESNLSDLLRGKHAPEQVAGSKLSEEELADLVDFLKTL